MTPVQESDQQRSTKKRDVIHIQRQGLRSRLRFTPIEWTAPFIPAFVMSIADHSVQADELGKKPTTKSVRWTNPFFKVFGKTPSPVPTTRRVPDGTRVYCVGDIHGRDDLLREMAERVEADMEGRSFDHAVTVFLGDYVDRGLGSMRVVERLSRSEWPTPMIALAGNHEDLLMAFLEDERSSKPGEAWVGSKPCIPMG